MGHLVYAQYFYDFWDKVKKSDAVMTFQIKETFGICQIS